MPPPNQLAHVSLKTLAINRCPVHGWWAVTIEDGSGGVRVTPSKCCGRWDTVKALHMSERDWRELARFAEEAADECATEGR